MSKVQSLHPAATPELSPARAALAETIAAAATVRGRRDAAHEAVTRAKRMAADAKARLAAAQNSVTQAKASLASRSAEAATSGTPLGSDQSLREARAQEVEAQEQLEAAQSALATVGPEVERAENAVRKFDDKVRIAANAVVADQIPRLLAEAMAAQARLVKLRLALRSFGHDLGVTGPQMAAVTSFLHDKELPGAFGDVEYQDWSHRHDATLWQNARDQLKNDAAAPLPE